MMIVKIDKNNYTVFFALAQNYEAEFSVITKKNPAEDGHYALDTPIDIDHHGYLLYDSNIPIGFAIVAHHSGKNDISEFYIIPSYRKRNFGKNFAFSLFERYKGEWQVRQIEGAEKALHFWRSVISEYTSNFYQELQEIDPYWGNITKQIFTVQKKSQSPEHR